MTTHAGLDGFAFERYDVLLPIPLSSMRLASGTIVSFWILDELVLTTFHEFGVVLKYEGSSFLSQICDIVETRAKKGGVLHSPSSLRMGSDKYQFQRGWVWAQPLGVPRL